MLLPPRFLEVPALLTSARAALQRASDRTVDFPITILPLPVSSGFRNLGRRETTAPTPLFNRTGGAFPDARRAALRGIAALTSALSLRDQLAAPVVASLEQAVLQARSGIDLIDVSPRVLLEANAISNTFAEAVRWIDRAELLLSRGDAAREPTTPEVTQIVSAPRAL